MPKSLSRGPARLLALAVALGGPAAVVTPADAATGDGVPTAPEVYAYAGPESIDVSWTASRPGTDTVEETEPGDETEEPGDETEEPGDETEEPGDETEEPGGETEEPGGETEEPGDELDPDSFEDVEDPYALSEQDVSDDVEEESSGEESGDDSSEEEEEEEVSDLEDNAIAFYEVALYEGDSEVPLDVDSVDADEELATGFDGLAKGRYQVYVTAYDAEGDAGDAGRGQADVKGYQQPDAPMIETADQVSGEGVDGGDGRVEVTYQEGDDRDFDVTRFEVVLFDWDSIFYDGPIVLQSRETTQRGAMGVWGPRSHYNRLIEVEPGAESATFDDVPAGRYATFVQAVYEDADGAERYSTAFWDFRRVDVVEVPGKAQAVTATATGPSSTRLTWAAPTAKDGVTISGYRIGVSGPQAGGFVDVPAGDRSFDTTDLVPGEYRFSVTALVRDDLGGDRVDAAPVVVGRAISPATPPTTTPVTPPATTPATPVTPAKPATPAAPKVSKPGEALQAGERATIGGTAAPGDVLQLQRRAAASSGGRSAAGFVSAGRTVADASGRYGFTRRFNRSTEVRVVNLTTGVVSPTSVVKVQKDLTLKAKRVAKRTYRLSGKVSPVGAGQVVTVLVERGERTVRIGRAVTDRRGTWSLRHTFGRKGTTAIRVVSAASDTNIEGSTARIVQVR